MFKKEKVQMPFDNNVLRTGRAITNNLKWDRVSSEGENGPEDELNSSV